MTMTSPRPNLVPSHPSAIPLAEWEFRLFRELIHARTGIALGPTKGEMLRARLSRRLRALNLPSYSAYYQFLRRQDPNGEEWNQFINYITTNVTQFFREEHHFRYLAEKWIPRMFIEGNRTGDRRLRIWSAGCSSGEEPYSIAAAVCEALGKASPKWDFRILASDISGEALKKAKVGVYPQGEIAKLPPHLLRKYFLCNAPPDDHLVRIRSEVQTIVTFRNINLVDGSWPIHTVFDAIFCRNVLIYFDRPTQLHVLKQMLGFLKKDGLLFLGHSENVHGLIPGLKHVENTIYRRET